jgi:thioredoxin-like negative regulator of GroEL
VQRFLSGDADGALDDALLLVKKHRAWRGGAGRALTVRFIDALGAGDARADKARRRLANLLFA